MLLTVISTGIAPQLMSCGVSLDVLLEAIYDGSIDGGLSPVEANVYKSLAREFVTGDAVALLRGTSALAQGNDRILSA